MNDPSTNSDLRTMVEDIYEESLLNIVNNSRANNNIIEDHSDEECEYLSLDNVHCNDFTSSTHNFSKTHNTEATIESELEFSATLNIEKLSSNKKKKRKCKKEATLEQDYFSNKISEIKNVISSKPLDLEKLQNLAIGKGGLVNDEMRKVAWPLLMQIDISELEPKPSLEIKQHKDYNQVVMDVNRTLKRFPPGIDEQYRYILMDELTALIVRVLDKHPDLHYYQGYHDVAITFLLVTGESLGYELVEKLSLTHLHEFMRPSMERTTYYLTYLYPILKRVNRRLYDFLIKSKVGTLFCLPWLITWYAHTLSDYRNVVRLYDFFLATPYLMPMYIAVAIVLFREKEILAEECDMAMQHFVLSQVPDTLPFEEILMKASELYSLYPPDEMQSEVELMVKERAEEEEEERRLSLERRRRNLVSKSSTGVAGIISTFTDRIYLSHRQKTCIKILAFAFTATLATGLYGYYSNSSYLRAYIRWS